MEGFIDTLNGVIWSNWLVFLCLGAGAYFTLATLFLQIRCIPDMLRQLKSGEKSEQGISSFQSLMISLAGRVGVGNIAGVATAIAFGGPGAVFWMWLVALLGSATSFVECCLAQIYKETDRDTGEYRGGPAYYIEKTYKHTAARPFMLVYAIVFAVSMLLATAYFLPGIQANGVAAAVQNAWGVNVWISAGLMAGILAFIIIGGVKRIANFASMVVPFMALIYIIIAIVVLFANASEIPGVFGTIVRSAFDKEAAFSGMLGAAIMWGVKRGIYSNESGQAPDRSPQQPQRSRTRPSRASSRRSLSTLIPCSSARPPHSSLSLRTCSRSSRANPKMVPCFTTAPSPTASPSAPATCRKA